MAEKDHATWSPSSCTRNLRCPGNLALQASTALPRTSSTYADYGTVAHTLSETRLRDPDFDLAAMVGVVDNTNTYPITVDDMMIGLVQQYVDYVESRVEMYGAVVLGVEVRLDLRQLDLPLEVFGTGDCVLWYEAEKRVEVVDLKTGAGKLVEATDNDQARCYGVGAILNYPNLKVEAVTTTIVQGRIAHDDGPIRSETVSTIELMEWVYELQDGVRRASKAMWLRGDDGFDINDWLSIGDHCTFCPAMGICPAQRSNQLALANEWFVPEERMSAVDIEADLERFEMVEEYIAARRALAHRMAESDPAAFQNWVLVAKHGHRRFTVDAPELCRLIEEARPGTTQSEIYDMKLKSPAAMERSLGKKLVNTTLKAVIEKPEIGTDLVRRSAKSDKRDPIESLVARFYDSKQIEG